MNSKFCIDELGQSPNKDRGQATLEFALVSFVLILLFMGIYQFGRILLIQQRCQMAVRHGAFLRAHSNLGYREIKNEMRSFFIPGHRERIWTDIDRGISTSGPLKIIPEMDSILNRFTGIYDISISYQVRTAPYFRGTLPHRFPVNAGCTIMRNSWAGLGQKVKDLFIAE